MGEKKVTARPGDPIYVPQSEVGMAHSLGAVMVEGDARLFIPNILPDKVTLDSFGRWTGEVAKIVWIGELLDSVVGRQVDLMDVAGLLSTGDTDSQQDKFVPLFVPSGEMDKARRIPGVHWDRGRRVYVADETADFLLVHRYLTPAMRALWISDRNLDVAMASMVKAQAMLSEQDKGDGIERELDPDSAGKSGED